MPRRRQKKFLNEVRWGKQEREKELKITLDKIRLRLGIVETMLKIEIIRRDNLVQEILRISSMTDLESLIKNFRLK